VLLVSLIGHYEQTAQHLAGAGQGGLGTYAAVERLEVVRVRARSLASMLHGAFVVARHAWTHRGAMIGVPRSNSRALRLLLALAPRTPVFSYSDGLGDSVHRFHREGDPGYIGHVGFASISPPPLIHAIPLQECIEPWGRWIRHDPAAPVLVIVKRPKEVELPSDYLAQVHARLIRQLRPRGVVLSGTIEGLHRHVGADVPQLGPLAHLSAPLALSAAVGLPSTALLTLATRLPANTLHVVRLGCSRRWPEAARRNRLMIDALQRCLPVLAEPVPPGERTGAAPPEPPPAIARAV
jgi:hypothetical protein